LPLFFFKKGISFDALADGELKSALNLLNCTYGLRSHLTKFRIRNVYLNSAYNDVKSEAERLLNNCTSICLLVDGWTSVSKRHFLNVLATTPAPVFMQIIPTNSNRVTAEYQCKVILECLAARGVTIDGFCSDHASVMKKTWKLLASKIPSLVTYGCAAHAIQSLGQSFARLPQYLDSLAKATKVSVYFRTHTQFHGLASLREAQSALYGVETALPIPTATRWHSSHDAVVALVKSQDALRAVVNTETWRHSNEPVQVDLNQILNDFNGFWDLITTYSKITLPIKQLIKFFESDRANLSDLLAGILAFASALKGREDMMKLLTHRCRKAITSWHVAAFLLNHTYVASVSIPSLEATEILCTTCSTICADASMAAISQEVASYLGDINSNSLYPTATSLWNVPFLVHQSPLGWWESTQTRFPLLARLARRLLMFPASAAASERVWSAAGDTLGTRRTRLLPNTLEKLVYIRFNSKLSDKIDASAYECPSELKDLMQNKHKDLLPFVSHLVSVSHSYLCRL
jgi:hypothetical protein